MADDVKINWQETSESWRKAHQKWQAWAAALLTRLGLQLEGGQYGDGAAMQKIDEATGAYKPGVQPPDVEARYYGKDLDEVCVRGVELLHLEYKDKNSVWIGVYLGGEQRIAINLHCKSQKIFGMVESDGEPAVVIREVRNGVRSGEGPF